MKLIHYPCFVSFLAFFHQETSREIQKHCPHMALVQNQAGPFLGWFPSNLVYYRWQVVFSTVLNAIWPPAPPGRSLRWQGWRSACGGRPLSRSWNESMEKKSVVKWWFNDTSLSIIDSSSFISHWEIMTDDDRWHSHGMQHPHVDGVQHLFGRLVLRGHH